MGGKGGDSGTQRPPRVLTHPQGVDARAHAHTHATPPHKPISGGKGGKGPRAINEREPGQGGKGKRVREGGRAAAIYE